LRSPATSAKKPPIIGGFFYFYDPVRGRPGEVAEHDGQLPPLVLLWQASLA
jgi:hypothetical protein